MRNLPRVALTSLSALLMSAGMAFAAPAEVTNDLNMRTGPGTNYGVVTVVPDGDTVDILNCDGGWCRVRYAGRTGWVSASYLDDGVAAAPRRRIIVEEEPIYVPPAVYGAPLLFGAPYYAQRRYYRGRPIGPRYDRRANRPVYRGGRNAPVYRGGGNNSVPRSFGTPNAQGGGNQFLPGGGGGQGTGQNNSVGYR